MDNVFNIYDAEHDKYISIPALQGPVGESGNGILSIELTNGNHVPGTLDTYTITFTDGTTQTFQIYNGFDGAGDMEKKDYDTNDNGIVDNAEKVNNHTVDIDVPANAKFTDTIYTLPIASNTDLGGVKVDNNTINIDTQGVISAKGADYTNVTNKPQINGIILTGNKTDSDLDLANKIHSHNLTDLNNDAGFIDKNVNDLTNYYTSTKVTELIAEASGDIRLFDLQPIEPII